MRKNIIFVAISFLLIACNNSKIIKLDSIALIDKNLIENEYKKNSYIKDTGYKVCITSPFMADKEVTSLSDKFFKIKFSSNKKIFFDYSEEKEEERLPQFIGISGSFYAPRQINFCPIVAKNNNRFIYTYFYPMKTKVGNHISDLRKVDSLKLNVSRTGSLSTGLTPSMRSNDVFISKKMINQVIKDTR